MKKYLFFYFYFLLINISQENRGYIVNIGDKSPEFSLNEKILEQNKGKVIMLQFTASWCSVCIREMPYIENEIWLEHKENEDFVLIALAKDTEQYPRGKKRNFSND